MSGLIQLPPELTPEERKAKIQIENARQEARDKAIMRGGLIKLPKQKEGN